MPAGYKMEITDEVIDGIIDKMEKSIQKMEDLQGKVVKLKNAEVETLTQFELGRNFMMELLQNKEHGREKLQNIFGGDCSRIARLASCVEQAKFSDMYAGDARHPDCRNACQSIEQVLADLGLGFALRKALDDQKERLKRARGESAAEAPVMAAPEMGTMEEGEMGTMEMEEPEIVVEEPPREPTPPPREPTPPPRVPTPPPREPTPPPPVIECISENLIDQILACECYADLAELPEPNKKESLGNWMIWMVHRAHLDDPTLIKFDFSNLSMPAPNEEPRISPKLAKAIESNTKIQQLLLPNTNLLAKEGGVIAESLTKNSTIRVFNVDSNFLGQNEMDSLANAAGVNQTLEELRVNNQHGLMMGRSTYEAFSNAVKANKMICKLGLSISDPHYRNEIDRSIMRNNDDARKRRVAAKKAAEAAAAEA